VASDDRCPITGQPVASLAREYEQRSALRVEHEPLAHGEGQRVERPAHVLPLGAHEDADRGRDHERGYATEMLRQGLDLARSMALARVLLTCDEDNGASRRVIEECGGRYEDSYVGPEVAVPKRRYWIALSSR